MAFLAAVFAGVTWAQVCSQCESEPYPPGGPTRGARGICEAAYSGFSSCTAGERYLTVTECDANGVCRQYRDCEPNCHMDGNCGTGGGGTHTGWFFEYLSDGHWGYFCPAEFAYWKC